MPLDRICFRAVGLESRRNVIVADPSPVEPILKSCAPAAMAEHPAIPYSLQRGHLVIAGAAPGLKCEIWIGADRNRQDVVFLVSARRRREAVDGSELVVGIERWRVAACAAFAVEYFLSARGRIIKAVRIGRRLERIRFRRPGLPRSTRLMLTGPLPAFRKIRFSGRGLPKAIAKHAHARWLRIAYLLVAYQVRESQGSRLEHVAAGLLSHLLRMRSADSPDARRIQPPLPTSSGRR